MRPTIFIFSGLAAIVVSATVTLEAAPTASAPTVQPDKIAPIRSVFVIPTNPKEGRDPFFPDSTRPYETITAAHHGTDLTALILKGISHSGNRYFAIINNHTFTIGDEEDILTTSGRIHIRCVEINPSSVVVEAGGQRTELTFANP